MTNTTLRTKSIMKSMSIPAKIFITRGKMRNKIIPIGLMNNLASSMKALMVMIMIIRDSLTTDPRSRDTMINMCAVTVITGTN